MFDLYPDVLTIGQVAEALRIGLKAAYGLVNSHQLGAIRIGCTIRVPKKALVDYVISTAEASLNKEKEL